ncbi:hypothetical protein A3SI_00450 [Nitritalea halalkaliphila LW7]|uniref:Uncharacterized protein n=1 Tax=Nitritalea halalkaliphila LW7 TaxID=1189621 RepID=I5CAN6_9BACT|nr:hypothetical protein [Nitritalea halalkaliphila]EIM78888.1 hypothetical protein A3SI_00450 [Nitritalea halalkaliphila LW7]
MNRKRLYVLLGSVLLLLSLPLIAMQFSREVQWDVMDFLMMGSMLLGTGTLLELFRAHIKRKVPLLVASGGLILAFLLLWAELAVGLFH